MPAIIILALSFQSCNGHSQSGIYKLQSGDTIINIKGANIESRFLLPAGYKRVNAADNSFAAYLRKLPLKPFGSEVLYYNGASKTKKNVYVSVVNMDIGNQDLQQCADAVIRLRAEYLYGQKDYKAIHFNFVSDGKPRYYTDYVKGDYSYAKFRKYMNYIFSYANTTSLHNELVKVTNYNDMQPGDVFVQKGVPYGHAVIVVDMAVNEQNKKIFMLAQSYMPAQETQILVNNNNAAISPWYELDGNTIYTPEWTFQPSDLRRFK